MITSDNDAVYEFRDVTLAFEKWGQKVLALDEFNMKVFRGDWVMIVGHNGSGKSSLLKSAIGWESPQTGTILLDGTPLNSISSGQMADKVHFLHQDPSQNSCYKMDLLSNLLVASEAVRSEKLARRELRARCQALLENYGLGDRSSQHPGSLSGGERQILGLLGASIFKREVLLLDEPTSQLDPKNAARCLDEIQRLHEKGMTILQVTHDIKIASERGTRTVGLVEGRNVMEFSTGSRSWQDIEQELFRRRDDFRTD